MVERCSTSFLELRFSLIFFFSSKGKNRERERERETDSFCSGSFTVFPCTIVTWFLFLSLSLSLSLPRIAFSRSVPLSHSLTHMISFLFNAHTFVLLITPHFPLLSFAPFHRTRPVFFLPCALSLSLTRARSLFRQRVFFPSFSFRSLARSITHSSFFRRVMSLHFSRSLCSLLSPSNGCIIFTPFSRSPLSSDIPLAPIRTPSRSPPFVHRFGLSLTAGGSDHLSLHYRSVLALVLALAFARALASTLLAYGFPFSILARPLLFVYLTSSPLLQYETTAHALAQLRPRRVSVDR